MKNKNEKKLFDSFIPNMKRHYSEITPDFIEECNKNFHSNPVNTIARNAIVATGATISTTNSTRLNQLSHIFLNSVKKMNVKATNQGHSGRCWMFAALNIFRHLLINALNLSDFEFSETYLFFWDKFERCNSYLQWFIDHPNVKYTEKSFEYMVVDYMNDGGWWNTFANLVIKYGLVPKSVMKETFQSDDTDDMNKIIKEHLDSCVSTMRKTNFKNAHEMKQKTMRNIYNILVKFLGEPPKKFDWSFTNDDGENHRISRLTPQNFLEMVIPDLDVKTNFVALSHLPSPNMKMYQKYTVKYTNNVYEGDNCTLYNVPIEELTKYAMKSISNGLAVWFVADVHKSYNWLHSALDDKLDDSKAVFGETYKFDKGDRIIMRNVQGTHAMTLTGFNVDEKGVPINWQVENSWGYIDPETPGMDGFLTMSHSWFKQYVTEVVVLNTLFSRTFKNKLETNQEIITDPWETMAPAVKSK